MKPQDVIKDEHRGRETPQACYACRHSYNDIEEGWNCTKFDAVIKLSNGDKLHWPGQACDRAYARCKGRGFERAAIPWVFRKHPFMAILSGAILTVVFGVFLIGQLGI